MRSITSVPDLPFSAPDLKLVTTTFCLASGAPSTGARRRPRLHRDTRWPGATHVATIERERIDCGGAALYAAPPQLEPP